MVEKPCDRGSNILTGVCSQQKYRVFLCDQNLLGSDIYNTSGVESPRSPICGGSEAWLNALGSGPNSLVDSGVRILPPACLFSQY